MKSYRWGIMGAGRISEKFCTALSFVEGSEVYAVASQNREKAKDYAARYNAARAYNNYDDLVKDDAVDIIYIATPHAFHFEQAMLCLRHNKAVLCEKPLTLSYRDSSLLVETAVKKNIFFMEGLWTACMPFMDKIKELIAAGTIGAPRYITADFGFNAPKDMNGRLYSKALGGGSVLDIGIYPISLATILLGAPAAVKSVSRQAATGVDEYANMILQYANGETAHLLSTLSLNTPIEALILGAKGSIHVKSPWFKATDFSLRPLDGVVEDFSLPHLCNGFEHEIKEVMFCLNNNLTQSKKVPHALTLTVSEIMDEVLAQAGVVY